MFLTFYVRDPMQILASTKSLYLLAEKVFRFHFVPSSILLTQLCLLLSFTAFDSSKVIYQKQSSANANVRKFDRIP